MISSSLQPISVGILGAGNMGSCLAKAFQKVPALTISYVYSPTLSRAENLAEQCRARAVSQMEPVFADDGVDIVAICLPTYTRLDTLKLAVKAEKHIFCEKPLALNREMAAAIRKLLEGYRKAVMVGQVLRFFWEYSRIRTIVQQGDLGQIGTVRLSRCVGYPGAESWFAEPAKSGGVILDLLIHDLDFLRWTFGEVKQIYAKSLTDQQRGILDYALLNMEMESGALAHLEGSWAHAVGSFHQTVEVCGSKGLLSYDSLNSNNFEWVSTLETQTTTGSRISIPEADADNDPYLSELRHFVDCIRNGGAPDVSYEEALKSCELAFLSIESSRKGIPLRNEL